MKSVKLHAAAAFIAALGGAMAASPAHTAQDLLVRDVIIVSPERAAPMPGQSVLIRDGRIAAIGPMDELDPGSAETVEGGGRYMTPGLMDSHHHTAFVPGMGALDDTVAQDEADLAAAYMRQQPRSLLYYGVTQILDPSPLGFQAEFEAAPLRPDFFYCGEIPTPGGIPAINAQPVIRRTPMRTVWTRARMDRRSPSWPASPPMAAGV